MTHTTTEIAAMIERLEHMSKNTRDEYLHELAGRSAAMLREVAAERDALAAMAKEIDHERRTLATNLDYAEKGRDAVEDRADSLEAERDALAERVNRIAYKDHDLSAGLSWSGYIICGDSKSISAVKAAIHYGSQIDSYRTQFAERTKELEAERDRLAAMVEKLIDYVKHGKRCF